MPQFVCRQTTRTEALTLLSNIFKFVGGQILHYKYTHLIEHSNRQIVNKLK